MSSKEIDIFMQRLSVDPLDNNAFLSLRNIYMRNGQYVDLAGLLEMRSSYLGNTPEAADHLFRAAEIWLNQVGDIGRGTMDLLRTLEISPNHRGAAERLERIYREAGDYGSLLQVLTKFVEGLETYEPGRESAKMRSSIYQQIGEIWETYYKRNDTAIMYYKKAAQVDPTNVMAIYLSRNIYLNAGDFETAARLYDLEINAEPDPERKRALLRELAILKERNLGDLDGAIISLRRAVVLGPNDPEALYDLGTALIRKNENEELTREELEVASDCFFKLSQISEPDVAPRYLETALDLLPEHQGALDMYEAACMSEGRWQDLKIRLQRSLDSIKIKQRRIPILRKLAKLCFEKLNQPVEALAYLEALEEFGDPSDLDLLAKVRVNVGGALKPAPLTGFEEEETVDQLMSTTKELVVSKTSAPAKEEPPPPSPPSPSLQGAAPAGGLLSLGQQSQVQKDVEAEVVKAPEPAAEERIARPLEEVAEQQVVPPKLPAVDPQEISRLKTDAEKLLKLAMGEKAEEKMRQVLKLVPDDQQAWTFLEKRLRSGNRFAELRDLLLEVSDSPYVNMDFKLQKLREAAALSETRLRDVDSSITVYKKMIQLDPSNQDARKNLEKILVTNKRWDDYIAFLEEAVYSSQDKEEKLALQKKIAEIHLLRRDDPKSAFESLWAALEINPADMDVIAKLDELALRMREWNELEKILKIELDHEESPAGRRKIYDRLLSLQDETLEDYEGAYDTCKKMLEEFPDDFDVLLKLANIQEINESYAELVVSLEKIANLTSDTKQKATCYKKIARIAWDQFDDSQRSAQNWEKYFELVKDDIEAYEHYEKLLEGLQRYDDLINMYRSLLEQKSLSDHHRFFMRKLGLLLSSDNVGRREEAMEVWKKLLEGGDDAEALRTLAVWHREKEEWAELVENIHRRIKIAEKDEDRVVLYKDLSEVLHIQLGKPQEAADALRTALKLDPNDEEALAMLRAICAEMGKFDEATQILEKEVQLMKDPLMQVEMLGMLAGWYREKLGDKTKAVSAYERLLQVNPEDRTSRDALEILYEDTGQWEKLLRLLKTKAKDAEEESEILGLLLKGANICEKMLGDYEKAWGWYKEIFSRLKIDEDIMNAIEKAAERMAQWADLATMYEDLASKAEGKEEKVRRFRQAANVLSENLGDNLRALNDIYQASIADPDMVELIDDADRFALKCKDWEKLAAVYDRISRGISDLDGRVMLLRRFGKVVWKDGGYPGGAVMPLMHASEEKPNDSAIFDEFNAAALEAGEYEILIDALDKRFKSTTDKATRIELKLKMARIMAEYLKDVDGAIKIIQDAVEVDPANERFANLILDAAKSIEANLSPKERGYVFSWLLKTYKQHADSYEASDPYRVVFLRQIARIFMEGLEDPQSAFVSLKDAHRLNPANIEILDELEKIAAQQGWWEFLSDHLAELLKLSIKMDIAKIIHERRAKILEEQLGQHEEAAEHYWQIIQCDPNHPFAFRKLADFYRTVGRFNDLLMLLESEVEKRQDKAQKVVLLKEIASVWEKDMNNKFEAIDVYKRILSEMPGDREAEEAIERLGKAKLGLALRLGDVEEEGEEEEKLDVESLRKSLIDEIEEEEKPGKVGEEKVPGEVAGAGLRKEEKEERIDMLPDWEDDIKTGEIPAQKVADILRKTEEEGEKKVEESPQISGMKEEEAKLEPDEDGGKGDEAEPVEELEDIEPLPTGKEKIDMNIQSQVAGAVAGSPLPEEKKLKGKESFLLDDESLKEVLEEEYEIGVSSEKKRDRGGDSLPPPPPRKSVKGRKSISTPPPPPPRKK